MAIKYPGLWYQQSGNARFKNAVFDGIIKYDKNHGQTGGRFSGDEHLSGKSPDRGTELCSIVEYMFSLENLYEIFGNNTLADRLEILTFNSLPGTTTPDGWAHQYDQQSNQVVVSVAKRDWSTNKDQSNIYGLMPNFACCLANMHQGWPKFVESMWMATNDNGLVAVTYGPSTVKAFVGREKEVTINEVTDYPFGGEIRLKINTKGSARFPLYLRMPGWAENVRIAYTGKSIDGKGGETVKLEEKWSDNDEIIITMPMKLRYETRFNNSVSLLRGPLYFALRIDKEYKSVNLNYNNFSYKGTADWEIIPKSDWNYGLIIDKDDPGKNNPVISNTVSQYPFADRGDMIWSSDSSKHIRWGMDAPLLIKVRGMKIKEWTTNSAGVVPMSPVKPEGIPEGLTLVPYGCTRLRITEFPVMDVVFMKDLVKQGL